MIDFVIVSYNTKEHRQNLYRQLRDMHAGEPITIVDNASEDGTVEWLDRLSVPTVIKNGYNAGYAPACNQGAEQGEEPFICFLNPDVILADGWLDGVMAAFEDDDVVLAGPVQLKEDGTPHGYNFVGGACMVVRRDWFEDVGGLDEALVFGHDDIDLTRRVIEAGKRWVVTEPAVTHLGGMSRTEESNALVEAGREHMAAKWGEVVLHWKAGHDWRDEAIGGTLVGVPAKDLTRGKMLELREKRGITKQDLIDSGLYEER